MLKWLKAIVFVLALIAPTAAYAQASIVGTVRDASGAVLPGVTVEASSPVLIEKTRSVVSGGTGQYSIENLRPGTYTVTEPSSPVWAVTASACGLQGSSPTNVGSASLTGVVVPIGGTVICGFGTCAGDVLP